ncbi:MAG: HlyD family efflux transporter periplasmic adaptor subunit [Pseudomonadota bacterium]
MSAVRDPHASNKAVKRVQLTSADVVETSEVRAHKATTTDKSTDQKSGKLGRIESTRRGAQKIARKITGDRRVDDRRTNDKGSDDQASNAISLLLLSLGQQAREAETEAELVYMMTNAPRALLKFRQAILLERRGKAGIKVRAVSSLAQVDRNSTFIRWAERLARDIQEKRDTSDAVLFEPGEFTPDNDPDTEVYPFKQMVLLPLKLRDGTCHAYLLFAREEKWQEPELIPAKHLCGIYAHSWNALVRPAKVRRRLRTRNLIWTLLAACLVSAMAIPVPLTVLAPAEITALDAYVVTAPIDGVVKQTEVRPNTQVVEGDTLVSFADTELSNQMQLAARAVEVAQARLQQAQRNSFQDANAKRELAVARSELNLKLGEYRYAQELLAKTQIKANRDGLVIYNSPDDWVGRPVATGERIMRIADPEKVELTIHLPVSDAIVLENGARVRLFLDSDPTASHEAVLKNASYHASTDQQGNLTYRVLSDLKSASGSKPPRIGLRGTAQIYGETVSLGYFLFRKPLALVRQWTGL